MAYKKPRHTNLVIFLIVVLIIMLNIPNNSIATDLGNYNLNDAGTTKLTLNVFDIKNLEIHIVDIFETSDEKLCKFDEIYIYGSLKSTGKFVRIRINKVEVSSGLKVMNKAQSEHYSRQDFQEPIKIISRTFNCNDEIIYIEFEENINIDYLQFVQNQNNEYKAFRTLNIKALS